MICRLFTYLTDCLFGSQTQPPRKEVSVVPKEALMKEASRLSNFNDLKAVNWNVPEIRRQIKEVSQEIRLLKKEIRTSYHQITWNEQCSLGALKHRATVLTALQAFRRGNIHFVNSSISDQFLWLEEHLSLDDRRDLARIEVQTP
jgi:hypothetical protein